MHLILCVDDRGGLNFCGRRLSRDRLLNEHILQITAGYKLWVHPDSTALFPDDVVLTDEAFLTKAQPGEYCFLESLPMPENVESVILYRWNRAYPSTEKLPEVFLSRMHMVHTEEFPGSSHKRITMEKYVP